MTYFNTTIYYLAQDKITWAYLEPKFTQNWLDPAIFPVKVSFNHKYLHQNWLEDLFTVLNFERHDFDEDEQEAWGIAVKYGFDPEAINLITNTYQVMYGEGNPMASPIPRSLSVGDIIVTRNSKWGAVNQCRPIGWERLER